MKTLIIIKYSLMGSALMFFYTVSLAILEKHEMVIYPWVTVLFKILLMAYIFISMIIEFEDHKIDP